MGRLTCVVRWLWPGLLRSNWTWISFSLSFKQGGHPSIITPTPLPCDSPKVEMRKRVPKELILEEYYREKNRSCLIRCQMLQQKDGTSKAIKQACKLRRSKKLLYVVVLERDWKATQKWNTIDCLIHWLRQSMPHSKLSKRSTTGRE